MLYLKNIAIDIRGMDKNFLTQLTTNLYHLTLLFPKKEPLRYKIRELADEVLANLLRFANRTDPLKKTENNSWQVLEDLEVLDSYFEIAKNQNWVSPKEVLNIQEEYSKLRRGLKELSEKEKSDYFESQQEKQDAKEYALVDFGRAIGGIEERQKKILEVLKEKGRAQVWELTTVFPEVTKRTLRRDFEQMLSQGLIERIGERNNTFYQLKIVSQTEVGPLQILKG